MCGLFLLNVSLPAWAANEKPRSRLAGKPVASKKSPVVKKLRKVQHPHPRSPVRSRSELGVADVVDAGAPGLSGQASFYGQGFSGRSTATGERFDSQLFTGASNHFPLGSLVVVRRLDSERCAIVKVNDRMHARHTRRIIDVSRGVAEHLEMVRAGVVLVRVAALKNAPGATSGSECRRAAEPENECLSCGRPPRLPDFGEIKADPA